MADAAPVGVNMDGVPLSSDPEAGLALEEGSGEAGEGEGAERVTPTEPKHPPKKAGQAFKPKNGCQKCCGSIMNLFANDAIYGSWVGPHPVSFFCICQPCRKCVSPSFAQPLCIASIATKAMNFIMLGFITLLACFFIAPWAVTGLKTATIKSLFPCEGKEIKVDHINAGCSVHGGYYMAYRCFFAFACVMLTNSFAMMDVTSTNDDPYRKRIHHGFWLYKYLYLLAWLIAFFCIRGYYDPKGYFEYTVSIIGNLAHVLFSFFELTAILDVVEIWAVSVSLSNNTWGNFMYRMTAGVIYILDIILLIVITSNFGFELEFEGLDLKMKAQFYEALVANTGNYSFHDINNLTSIPTVDDTKKGGVYKVVINALNQSMSRKYEKNWPYTNCLPGQYIKQDFGFFGYKVDGLHFGMICGTVILSLVLVVVMLLKQQYSKRFPYQGWLQVAVIILFNLFYLWSALFNSSHIHSRPRCNWALRNGYFGRSDHDNVIEVLQDGSHDTYFRFAGFFHGQLVIFALFYYAFVHGPRSKTAPLSLGYRHFIAGGYDRAPVYPDLQDSPSELKRAIEKLEVWDDEQTKVAQSWSTFYVMMVLGSLSLMMSMTNFTNPWAKQRYNTSDIALAFKYTTAVGVTLTYIFFLICPCTRVYRAYQAPIRKRRVVRKPEPKEAAQELAQEPEEFVIELVEEEEEAWYY